MPLDRSPCRRGRPSESSYNPPIQLGNQGDLLTLLNPAGLKVDGVAYTRQQAEAEERTVVF